MAWCEDTRDIQITDLNANKNPIIGERQKKN